MEKGNKKNKKDKTDKRVAGKYDHRLIEPKWVAEWEKAGIYQAVDLDKKTKKYILFEFPYPSGERLHIGHAFTFTGTDVLARFYRMQGFNVLCPMGWDAFGLPAENYAIKTGINPMITTAKNIANSKVQAKHLGLSVDWNREIATIDPKYYQWTQWIFLQWYKKGLAYKAEIPINWCPKCKIGLANEEVLPAGRQGVAGKCERCGAEVTRRRIKQWIIKITAYADRLIEGLKNTDFIEKVKAAQINWVGRSEGAEIEFRIRGAGEVRDVGGVGELRDKENKKEKKDKDRGLTIFTTRSDTLYGATFMVVCPEHWLVERMLGEQEGKEGKEGLEKRRIEIREYVESAGKKSEMERTELAKEKKGVFSGLYAINPATGKEIPIWISDFVLSTYGTGAIMAVPAHDERDWQFAKKYHLPIVPVVLSQENKKEKENKMTEIIEEKPYCEAKGFLINSGEWDELKVPEEMSKIIDWLEKKGVGKKSVSYHLRDWIFSRQHYWGEPIPMVFCAKCAKDQVQSSKFKVQSSEERSQEMAGWFPVPEEDLPVELPKVDKYQPTETGESPLVAMTDWVNVTCPKCGGPAKRETDTMPNWAGSDWYYLAYPIAEKLKNSKFQAPNCKQIQNSNDQNSKVIENCKLKIENSQNIFEESKNILGYWLPVDIYVGGDEHNTLHLLYSRFTYQFLWDIGAMPKEYPEPYYKRLSHGVILGPDGQRMSKSRGNVINPDEIWEAFGVDALRTYLMFMGPFESTMAWSQESLEGCYRFIKRVWRLVDDWEDKGDKGNKGERGIERKLNQTIKKVGEDIEKMKFNTAVAAMMELLNKMDKKDQKDKVDKGTLEKFLLILAPFAPYLTEELWERLGNKFSIHQQKWPEYDPCLIVEETVTIAIQVNGKLRGTIEVQSSRQKGGQAPFKVQSEVEELAKKDKRVKKYTEGQEVKKVIFVAGKLINFVI